VTVASADPGDVEFDGNDAWGQLRIKRRISALVGWDAHTDDPVLSSREAYELVFFYLYDTVLPPDRFVDREECE